jgi:hypothetical protein
MRIIFLAIMLLAGFEAVSLKTIAQSNKTTDDDNLALFKFMYQLNRDIVIDHMAPADTLNAAKVNKVVLESKISYMSGGFCYSPDRSFKIFSAEGSDCSTSQCNCLNASRLYFTSTGKSVDMGKSFLYIDTIYKLGHNKYLALQSTNSCEGTARVTYKRATFFSILNDKITYYPIRSKADTTLNSDYGLSLFQYNLEALSKYPFILKFDSANKRLLYSYVLDADNTLNTDAENYVTGYYEYKNGAFYNSKKIIKRRVRQKLN